MGGTSNTWLFIGKVVVIFTGMEARIKSMLFHKTLHANQNHYRLSQNSLKHSLS